MYTTRGPCAAASKETFMGFHVLVLNQRLSGTVVLLDLGLPSSCCGVDGGYAKPLPVLLMRLR
eukprot:365800-Chlamydomonas_euryale.AAC.17